MSLKFPKNKIKTFGSKLPTIYFDRIELYNDKFKLQLSIYTEGIPGEQEYYEAYFEKYVKPLNFYVMLVLDGTTPPQFNKSTMPPPLVHIDNEFTGMDAINLPRSARWLESIYTTAATYGLDPADTSGGDLLDPSATLVSAAETTYTSLVPNYYKPNEIGQYTSRIKRLADGEISVLELIRRNNDYTIPGVAAKGSPLDIFIESGTLTNERRTGPSTDVTPSWDWKNYPVTLNNLYKNPYTNDDGDYLMESVLKTAAAFGDSAEDEFKYVFSDPQLTDDPIGYVAIYPPNKGNQGNIIQIDLAEHPDEYEIIKNDDGTVVYKRTFNIDHAFASNIGQWDDGMVDVEYDTGSGFSVSYTFGSFVDQLHRIPEMHMVAFSSMLDLNIIGGNSDYIQGLITPSSVFNPTDPITEALAERPISKLNAMMTSDVVYEKVTSFGHIENKEIMIYVDASGDEYDGDAIRAINLGYYGLEGVTLEGIKLNFEASLNSDVGRALTTSDEKQYTDIKNEIRTILSVYGKDPNLLVELDKARKNFTDTSRSTATGRFYQKFRDHIMNTNTVVINGEQLTKRKAINPVVVDRRSTSNIGDWSSTLIKNEPDRTGDPDPIKLINPYLARVAKFADRYQTQAVEWWELPTNPSKYDLMDIYINGFYFFDYEKAIQTTSNLNDIVNVANVEKYYGREITQNHFKLESNTVNQNRLSVDGATLTYTKEEGEWYRSGGGYATAGTPSHDHHMGQIFPLTFVPGDASSGPISTTAAHYDLETPTTAPKLDVIKFAQRASTGDFADQINPGLPETRTIVISDSDARLSAENDVLNLDNGAYEYSYTCLRNIEFLNELKFGEHPYRLMGFEFQNVIPNVDPRADYEPTFNDFLEFECSVADDTEKIYEAMVTAFASGLEQLKQYAAAAAEFCSYNNLDGEFNQFFADHQNSLYPEAGAAPWHYMPVLYYTHLDILTNYSSGNAELVYQQALKASESISPETGTLDNLAFFVSQVSEFYETYYSLGSVNSPAAVYAEKDFFNARHSLSRTYGGGAFRDREAGTDYASTYFPLPTLEEVLIDPPVLGETDSGEVYDDLRMVQMKFGFFNVPSGLIGLPVDMHVQTDNGTVVTEPVPARTFKPTVHIQPSTANIGNSFMFPTSDPGGGAPTTITAANLPYLLNWSHVNRDQSSNKSVAISISGWSNYDEVPGLIFTPEYANMWLSSDDWINTSFASGGDVMPGIQSRAATSQPKFVPVWLLSGIIYDITFQIIDYSPTTSADRGIPDKYSEDMSEYNQNIVWQSQAISIKIPSAAHPNKDSVDFVATEVESETHKYNEFFLDCTNLDKTTVTSATEGGSSTATSMAANSGLATATYTTTFGGDAKIYAANDTTGLRGDQSEVDNRWKIVDTARPPIDDLPFDRASLNWAPSGYFVGSVGSHVTYEENYGPDISWEAIEEWYDRQRAT